MRILILNGSHRTKGNCDCFAQTAEKLMRDKHSVRTINLVDCQIERCNGCLICEEGDCCPIPEDDYSRFIRKELMETDLIIFASPTYFNMPSAALINLLDRTNDLCDYFAENQKKAWVFLVGQTDEESIMDAYKCIKTYMDIMNMDEIDAPGIEIARMPQTLDESIKTTLKNI